MNGRVHSLRADPVSREDALSLREELERRLAEHSALAFRVAYGVLRQREDAEDVAQEALVRAFQRLGRLRDRERFQAWLVRTSWRAALDHRRTQKRREQREQAAASGVSVPTPEQLAAESEFRERLLAAIDDLPEKLRIVVILCGLQDRDSREVASLHRDRRRAARHR